MNTYMCVHVYVYLYTYAKGKTGLEIMTWGVPEMAHTYMYM